MNGDHVSSIPDIIESRQDSNVFSNSKHDIENSFNSQVYDDKGNKNE